MLYTATRQQNSGQDDSDQTPSVSRSYTSDRRAMRYLHRALIPMEPGSYRITDETGRHVGFAYRVV